MFIKVKTPIILIFTVFVALLNFNVAIGMPSQAKTPILDRVDFVHYAKNSAKATGPKNNSCYKLMGVKWNSTPVNYFINPANPEGIDETTAVSTFAKSAETWDASTSKELFNDSYTVDYTASYGVQDYKNSIAFGAYSDNSAIAVTSVWYTRVGKQIVEFDQIYNTYFSWGDASLDPTIMDLENIATHELGHAVGLADIYSLSCGEVTMYGYGTEGEVKKRTLEIPDIQGLQRMYGI